MRLTFVGHASLLVETNGISLLSDPWWSGPCFGAQWWAYPTPRLDLLEQRKLDYIYLSHGHHDHFHPGTLTRFDRGTEILVSSTSGLGTAVRRLGFTVREIAPETAADLGSGVRVRIIPTHDGDTLMTITDGREVCVNANDALHSLPQQAQDKFISQLRAEHPTIDYVFCGYGTASHFPNCYRIPGKDMAASAAKRQHHFNSSWARIIDALAPSFGFPFAADVVFLEADMMWANEPVHNTERPTDLFRQTYAGHPTHVADIAPGFCIENHQIRSNSLHTAVSNTHIKAALAVNVEQANRYPPITTDQVGLLRNMLASNIERRREYLESFPGNYRFLVSLRNSDTHLEISKRRKRIEVNTAPTTEASYDLTLTTRGNYLKNCMGTEFGCEVLLVGSGCQISYHDRELVSKELHRELLEMITHPDRPLAPRYGGQSRALFEAKRLVKSLMGRSQNTLYSLEHWTQYIR